MEEGGEGRKQRGEEKGGIYSSSRVEHRLPLA